MTSMDPCSQGFNGTYGSVFERKWCFEFIKEWLTSPNTTVSPACMRDFFLDGINTSPDNPLLTLKGCKKLCGFDWGYYPDSISRVIDWVVPIIVLLSNINLSPVERRTMIAIIHAVGDPIDTLWSLLDKLYAWYLCSQVAERAVDRAYGTDDTTRVTSVSVVLQEASNKVGNEDIEQGGGKSDAVGEFERGGNKQGESRGEPTVEIRPVPTNQSGGPGPEPTTKQAQSATVVTTKERTRIIATVLAGFEELTGPLLTQPARFYQTVIDSLGNVSSPNSPAHQYWQSAALSLVDDRTNEFLRTGIAITLYLFQVFSEFIDQISQNNENTPGGRIGAAMMLSWLIPVALLSNLLGGLPSRRSNLKSLLDLVNKTYPQPHLLPDSEQLAMLTADNNHNDKNNNIFSSWDAYFSNQHLTGAIYGFRPFKTAALSHASGSDKGIRLLLPILAALPVAGAFVASFILHWEAVPAGFSCRHVWVSVVFGLWILSVVFTNVLPMKRLGCWYSRIILIKDAIIGFGTIGMIIASVIGVFNSCFCWSLAMWVGEARAVMVVNTKARYLEYKTGLYPGLVGGFVLLQTVFVAAVGWGLWKGLWVARWGEGRKRRVWAEGRKQVELAMLRGVLDLVEGDAAEGGRGNKRGKLVLER